MNEATSESELIGRAQGGDAEAFATLARSYERRVLLLALHYARDRHDAEDLSQEVWLKAFRAISSFRGESSFYTWLRQITINTFLNERRAPSVAAGRQARVVEFDAWEASKRGGAAQQQEAVTQEAALSLARPSRGVEESFDQQFLVARVLDALGDLTPQQRLIFLLKHQEGMTYEEISEALGCSAGTTKKALFRAVLKLRERLGVNASADEDNVGASADAAKPLPVRKSC
ncbi:MAG: polymerase sigma-70 factor, subfamily [Pyrinomonadaceae bacterium]|nr:polymerase sigma-70 factor, subfamily [Pyrinomonadaceae bacterium]